MYCCSDKRFPMPCHTLSIQVCRSTCFVKCKHAQKFLPSKWTQSKTQKYSRTCSRWSTVQVGCARGTFWTSENLTFTDVGPESWLHVKLLTCTVTTLRPQSSVERLNELVRCSSRIFCLGQWCSGDFFGFGLLALRGFFTVRSDSLVIIQRLTI